MTTPKSEFERELENAIVEMLADDNTEPIEIRAARWGCEWGYNHGKAVKDALYKVIVEENKELIKERDRLEAENSKLRAALKQIALGDGYYGAQAKEYKEIARKALGGE